MKRGLLRFLFLFIVYLLPFIILAGWSFLNEPAIELVWPGTSLIKDFRGTLYVGLILEALWIAFVTVFLAEPIIGRSED